MKQQIFIKGTIIMRQDVILQCNFIKYYTFNKILVQNGHKIVSLIS